HLELGVPKRLPLAADPATGLPPPAWHTRGHLTARVDQGVHSELLAGQRRLHNGAGVISQPPLSLGDRVTPKHPARASALARLDYPRSWRKLLARGRCRRNRCGDP